MYDSIKTAVNAEFIEFGLSIQSINQSIGLLSDFLVNHPYRHFLNYAPPRGAS
jgi:hypothetical protein